MRALLRTIRRSHIIIPNIRKYGKPPRCDAHMNELPVPCGPWDIHYNDQQAFYTKVMAGGILWFSFSFAMMVYTESVFFNWGPPQNPGPPSDMVEECEDL